MLLLESQPAAIYQIRDVLSFARWALRVPLQVFEVGFAFPCFSVSLNVTVVLLQPSLQNLCQLVNSLNAVFLFFFFPPTHAMKEAKLFSLHAPQSFEITQNPGDADAYAGHFWHCCFQGSRTELPTVIELSTLHPKMYQRRQKPKMAKMLNQNSQQILDSPNSHGCETLSHDTD